MGQSSELRTVTAAGRGAGDRKYGSESADSPAPARMALVVLVLSVAAYAKKVFWPSSHEPDQFEPESSTGLEGDEASTQARASTTPGQDGEEAYEGGNPEAASVPQTKAVHHGSLISEEAQLTSVSPEHAALDKLRSGQSGQQVDKLSPGNDNQPVGWKDLGSQADTIRLSAAPTDSSASPPLAGDPPRKPEERLNHAPIVVGRVDLGKLAMNSAVAIGLSSLLAQASDPDGDRLVIEDLTVSSGSIESSGSGTWIYTPALNDDGVVTFSYVVTDGEAKVTQSAILDLVATVDIPQNDDGTSSLVGTPFKDVLVGTIAGEELDGQAGNDVIYAGAGDDIIAGGDGNDVIFAGAGNDIVMAGAGDDVVFGEDGNDILFGEAGIDVLFGGDGNDVLSGGDGADQLVGGHGADAIDGGGSNDVIVATVADGNDAYNGGDGIDTLDLSATSSAAIVDLVAGTSTSAETGSDQVASIENVVGSSGGDQIAGDMSANVLTGGGGDDAIDGGGSNDVIVATVADGNDAYNGGDGIDTLDLSATSSAAIVDLVAGTSTSAETGSDQLSSIENVIGSQGDDTIISAQAGSVLSGGGGDDTFVFVARAKTNAEPQTADVINDFQLGDKIDVQRIDGDDSKAGHQDFEFRGRIDDTSPDEKKAGTLKYKYEVHDDGEVTVVVGYTSDMSDGDLKINLIGHHEVTKDSFYGVH